MSAICVDASVAVKWVLPEDDSDEALRLWRSSGELWSPDLLLIECANAIRHRVEHGPLEAEDAVRLLRALLGVDLNLLSSREIAEEALGIALQTGLTVWDACYVVVARGVGAELWTADHQLHKRGTRIFTDILLLGRDSVRS